MLCLSFDSIHRFKVLGLVHQKQQTECQMTAKRPWEKTDNIVNMLILKPFAVEGR